MPEHSDAGRNIHERVGALEQDMAVVKHDQARFERIHELSPHRITKLEEQFSFQNKQLQAIGETQEQMSTKMDALGNKIAYGLGAAAVILALFDKVWPLLTKGI